MPNLKGPKFVQYFQPVINGLRDLGSSAKPKEVYGWIAEHHDIPKAEIEGTTKGGQSKFENKVGWARFYLAKAGLIDTEQRGVWVLTEQGRKANLSHDDAYQMFRKIHDGFPKPDKQTGKPERAEPVADEDARENTTAIELVDIDRLLELLIDEGLGVPETKALTIEHGFFEPYM